MAQAKATSYPEHDYMIIESALTASKRGRWFLDTYTERHGPSQSDDVISTVARLADLVERQEATLNSILNPADLTLVKKALSIVEQYLSTGEDNTLVGLAHDLEKNDELLSTASENLILAAASLKMGNVDDTVFAQIVSEAERIQDARRYSQSAKSKIATLFQALSLLEGHLRKLCGETALPAVADEDADDDATQLSVETSDTIEQIDVQSENPTENIDHTPVADEPISQAVAQESSSVSDTDDHDDDEPGSGFGSDIEEEVETMNADDIDALFANSEVHDPDADAILIKSQNSEPLEAAHLGGDFRRDTASSIQQDKIDDAKAPVNDIQSQQERVIMGEKLAETMVGKIKNSFQAKIAEQQLKFFTSADGVHLKMKPA